MFKLLVLATLLGVATAFCPNACSAHGKCQASPKDSCLCFTRRETELDVSSDVPAWTGADCSDGFWGEGCRRSACPNECSGHGTCKSLKVFADDYSHDADDSFVSKQFGIPSSHPNTAECRCQV